MTHEFGDKHSLCVCSKKLIEFFWWIKISCVPKMLSGHNLFMVVSTLFHETFVIFHIEWTEIIHSLSKYSCQFFRLTLSNQFCQLFNNFADQVSFALGALIVTTCQNSFVVAKRAETRVSFPEICSTNNFWSSFDK